MNPVKPLVTYVPSIHDIELDVKSADKGLLLQRMATVQRIAIVSPANGLAVFDTYAKNF